MPNPASPCIGIDFADDKIRLARLKFDPFAYVESVQELSLPGYLSEDHLVYDAKALQTILKTISSELPRGTRCVFSMPNSCSNFNWMRLAGMEGKDLYDAARYRVRRGEEDVERIAVAVVESDKDERLVVSSSAEVLQQRKDLLQKAGFDVVGAEVQAQSVLRSVAESSCVEASFINSLSLTIAHITEDSTCVIVVQNGKLNFMRSSRIGYSGLLAKAAETLAISVAEIEPILFNYSASMDSEFQTRVVYDDRIYSLDTSQPMNAFVKEFRRVQSYFRSLHPDRSFAGMIDRLIISGLPSLTKGFNKTLSSALGLRVEGHRPTWRLPVISDDMTVEALGKRAPSFTVPIGLAMAPYGTPADHTIKEEPYVWTLRSA